MQFVIWKYFVSEYMPQIGAIKMHKYLKYSKLYLVGCSSWKEFQSYLEITLNCNLSNLNLCIHILYY